MSIIKARKIWFGISALLMVGSIMMLSVLGLNLSIDFTGGSLMEVAYTEAGPDAVEVRERLEAVGFDQGSVQPVDDTGLLIRQPHLSEEQHQEILTELAAYGEFEELRFDSIGPVIGTELKNKSIWALLFIFIAIIAYVAWSFRKVGEQIDSWKYGVVTIIAALHDIILPIGIFAILGNLVGATVGTAFVAAVLTVLGYSVNDTIVVFDRIRENLTREKGKFEDIVDLSVKQTIARSLNTSITTLLALIAIYIFGGETIKEFVLVLIIGIASGAYSSIFLASPLLVAWQQWEEKRA